MAFKLPPEIYSPQLLEAVMYEIEQYIQWARQVAVQQHVGVTQLQSEPSYSPETKLLIQAWSGQKQATVTMLEELLDYLHNLTLPHIHLTLAAIPGRVQRETIVRWFHQHVSDMVLISFVADRTIGGGVIVRTPNHLIDCSWRSRLIEGRRKVGAIVKHA